ncbi:Rieske (2Fe-2S) iron-sulfur domain protein [Thalassoporum mexicanum PCC 7367]|uniref:aromatic ring-hydroxylating dioxygenase subunit alpha n=1 Tax=Thalassoporum mexicanum TaxID=3457544 RepID=UPI00029FB725|nr:aromatic ring-hydroxylating dioxygenase subunit alpha [Pseudanabaena sp. PCC 7367]AFY71665.1 Rieske (2Fe-2S) iron-sulfur domain protein [Pseudanabaena sp. PCC 7367]
MQTIDPRSNSDDRPQASSTAANGEASDRNAVATSNQVIDQASPKTKSKSGFDVRRASPNPNHWYVVALSSELQEKPLAVTFWGEAIVIYRDSKGQVHALEDTCPHRFVKLSHGCVVGDHLECAYHGWQFNDQGNCAVVPYLAENQKLPNCQIKRYAVQDLDGFIWLFPGDLALAEQVEPMGVPEWDHLNYIASVTTIDTEAHYSYLIENLMDMYHGHLHDNYQAWASASLLNIEASDRRVDAHYEAQSYYRIDKIWSVSQLFFPQLRRLHPEPLDVSYVYPHWASRLGDDFKIFCLFCPVSPTHTRAYLLHFTSLNAFWRLHKLPVPFRRFVKNLLFNAARGLLEGLVVQDVVMVEEEQQAYLKNPSLKSFELNKALGAVQKLIRQQSESI